MPRLLPLLYLLLLSQASLSQQAATTGKSEVPETCPVTTQYQASPFIPPKPYPQKAFAGAFWFGTDKLWAAIPVDGAWRGLGHYTPNDPTFRQKLFWWRQGYDWHTEPQPRLKVTGRRLDADADPLMVDRATNVSSEPGGMLVGINFPTVGCWEITGHYGDDALTFVVWITSGEASCDPPATRLPASNPAYADSMELAATLNHRGVRVQCVLLAKMENMFEGQIGAAFFRTDVGDFEAFFLPKSESWDGLEIVEQHRAGEYGYQFRGAPKYFGYWEGRRTYFVKHRNELLNSLDKQTAAKLNDALQNN